ncbi:PKD domain-containing protein [Chitinophaga sp. 22536]|uniref:PKD domain-containing protein n=1 Tax=unclassified Chitinophaga TaxID=2619133 RepID=UPI003F8784F4
MKKRYTLFCKAIVCLLFLSLVLPVSAQQTEVTLPAQTVNNVAGYLEALPQGYNSNTNKYPLIIFCHGVGELQYDANNPTVPRPISGVANNGIPKLIKEGKFPASFSVNGQNYSFIVISPFFIRWPGSDDVHKLLAYLQTKYRIDPNRIYVTGISMGGGVAWGVISENSTKAKQYAAAAIVCGAYNVNDRPELPAVIAANHTPVWAFHNKVDPNVDPQWTIDWVNKINSSVPAPVPPAKMTIFNVSGHDAWTQAYSPAYKDPVTGQNVYEWMLSYSLNATTPPPPANKRIVVQPNRGNGIYYTDAMKQLNVNPGDTLCIPAGDYDYIQFSKLAGTNDKPVVITNCGGLVRVGVNSTATAAAFVFSTCSYFKLEGTGDANLPYGFDVNGTNQHGEKMFGLFFGDGSTDFDVHHVYVHDASMFVQAKTLQSCDHPEWWEGSFLMKNIKIHDLLCRNSTWEGFYIGNTHYLYSSGSCQNMKSHHIQDLEVYNNDLENMGSDGIQISMADLGTNKIHDNRVVNYAVARNSAHGYGIMSGGGSTLNIYNNRVDKGYNPGIQIFGSGINTVYNNVVSNITYEGINAIDKIVFEPATAYIYNNTVYNTGVNGIKIYADQTTVGHKVYNNLVIANGTQWDYPQTGYYIKGANPIKFDFSNNLNFKTPADAGIGDAPNGNFRLVAGSKAIDAGRDMTDLGLTTDLENTSRPQDGKYDVGAYEFRSGTNNIVPAANAGKDLFISLPVNTVKLDGSASSDADGTITGYSWKKVSGPAAGTIAAPGQAITNVSGLAAGTYVFQLAVTDNRGLSASDLVTVTVLATAARQPVIVTNTNISVKLPVNSVQLDASSSYDPDGIIAGYEWKQISGPSSSVLADNISSNTSAGSLVQGVYTFQLTVTNNAGTKAIVNVTVTVTGSSGTNQPPVANAGADQTITAPAAGVTLNGSASADPDGSIAAWKWEKISGPAAGTIGSPATAITAVTNLTPGTYVFQLTVTDNAGATASARVTVTVLPQPGDNRPPVANAGPDEKVVSVVILDGSSSYDPDGSIVKYGWEQVNGPAAANIAGPNAVKATATGLQKGVYTFRLTVTDNGGLTASAVKTVTVVDPDIPDDGTEAVSLYPNRITGSGSAMLKIKHSSLRSGRITIYSSNGVTVKQFAFLMDAVFTTSLDFSALGTGVYFVEIRGTDTDYKSVKRFIKL